MRAGKVLLVEDEELTRNLLEAYLEKEGYEVHSAATGADMFARLSSQTFDIVFLDLGLPDEDGLVLLRQLRRTSHVPVIVLTSRRDRDSILNALELRADDYLTKPYDPSELALRARNVLERARIAPDSAVDGLDDSFSFCGVSLNFGGRTLVGVDGTEISLTRAEFDVLAALSKAANRVLTRSQLLDATAHFGNEPDERTIDAYVSRLRRKLTSAGVSKPSGVITTVPGIGYKLMT